MVISRHNQGRGLTTRKQARPRKTVTGMRNEFSVAGSGADLRERQYVYPVSRPTEERPALWRDFGGVKIAEIVHNDATGHRCSGAWPIGGDGACVLMLNLEGTTALTDERGVSSGAGRFARCRCRSATPTCGPRPRSSASSSSLPQAPIPMPQAPCLIDSGDGIAAVLGGLISTLLHGTGPFCGREQAALRDVIVQLVAAACSARRQCSSPVDPAARCVRLAMARATAIGRGVASRSGAQPSHSRGQPRHLHPPCAPPVPPGGGLVQHIREHPAPPALSR